MTGMGSLVWLASYPKSGNTWMRLFLENYFRNGRQPANINEAWRFCYDESKPNWYEPYAGGRPTPDLSPEEIAGIRPRAQRDIANSVPGTIFVKTHNFMGEFDGHPLHNLQVTAGGIYIIRNPLDVVLDGPRSFQRNRVRIHVFEQLPWLGIGAFPCERDGLFYLLLDLSLDLVDRHPPEHGLCADSCRCKKLTVLLDQVRNV